MKKKKEHLPGLLMQMLLFLFRRLLTEHEQLETLMVYCHEKFKEQFLTKAEQRDSMLKSEKFKVKSFDELLQRYLKLQDASKKLHKVCVYIMYPYHFSVHQAMPSSPHV